MRTAPILLLSCIAMAGCATVPAPNESITAAASVTAFQFPSDGDATIVVTRDKGMTGSACGMAVFIDGAQVAVLDTKQRATFHVPNGTHVVGTWNAGRGICSHQVGKNRSETDASLKPGETRRYRIGWLPDTGVPVISPTTL